MTALDLSQMQHQNPRHFGLVDRQLRRAAAKGFDQVPPFVRAFGRVLLACQHRGLARCSVAHPKAPIHTATIGVESNRVIDQAADHYPDFPG